ncbi:hypothetical protein HMPREF9551_02458 [Escherichia coli MS 196-1]|nr:hypothetical protein HMPREF9551_02458 [Escherichia coli MS 196-1]
MRCIKRLMRRCRVLSCLPNILILLVFVGRIRRSRRIRHSVHDA